MRGATTYYRCPRRDVWHWVLECSSLHGLCKTHGGLRGLERRRGKPTVGELCNQCRAKARRRT